jgi:dGTPase
MPDSELRDGRFNETPTEDGGDYRTRAQRDRDRLLYSSALRRLAEITQVVSPGSGYVFHNRLTHTLQVAQVGRRLAERLRHLYPKEVNASEGLDPDVVEAACLAHDLGHPPFGHIAEEVLNEEAREAGGFEGNAQSFRIVTKLAFRSPKYLGLDLSRATLAGILKYPWLYGDNPQKTTKWGAYESEKAEFNFARSLIANVQRRTIEASLMDVADDITYSVHDMEDFYRAGRIPLHLLAQKDGSERLYFFNDVFERNKDKPPFSTRRSELEAAFTDMVTIRFWVRGSYLGTREHRAALRGFTGQLIDRYIRAIQLQEKGDHIEVRIDQGLEDEITMFKQLTWTYVINAPDLATQQLGQREIVRRLYGTFEKAALKHDYKLFPAFYRQLLEDGGEGMDPRRICVDFIAGLTETQCGALFRRITGTSASSAPELAVF